MSGLKVPTQKPRFYAGETIEMSVSSHVRVDGDENWIGTKIVVEVQPHEIGSDARKRAQTLLMETFEETVKQTVAKIRSMGE